MDLYGYKDAELFYELLDELSDETMSNRTPDSIHIKIATRSDIIVEVVVDGEFYVST